MKKNVRITIALLSPVLFLVLAFAGTEANKAYWDWQVRKMCEKDGGAHVYEKIYISSQELDALGRVGENVAFGPEGFREGEPVYKERYEEVLKEWSPRVTRVEEKVFKRGDDRIKGVLVSYHRVGGGVPTGIFHSSSYKCPENPEYYEIQKDFFAIQGGE